MSFLEHSGPPNESVLQLYCPLLEAERHLDPSFSDVEPSTFGESHTSASHLPKSFSLINAHINFILCANPVAVQRPNINSITELMPKLLMEQNQTQPLGTCHVQTCTIFLRYMKFADYTNPQTDFSFFFLFFQLAILLPWLGTKRPSAVI